MNRYKATLLTTKPDPLNANKQTDVFRKATLYTSRDLDTGDIVRFSGKAARWEIRKIEKLENSTLQLGDEVPT